MSGEYLSQSLRDVLVRVYVSMYSRIYIYVYIHTYIYICVTYMYMYMNIYLRMYEYIYIYPYMHIHGTHAQKVARDCAPEPITRAQC